MIDRAQRIERLAKTVWELDGKPEGRSEQHWKIATFFADMEMRMENSEERFRKMSSLFDAFKASLLECRCPELVRNWMRCPSKTM